MFKDKANINHKTKSTYSANIKELAAAIKAGNTRNFLLENEEPKKGVHRPEHKGCTYSGKDNTRITEKRLCRCMHYYNLETPAAKCEKCPFTARRKNEGEYIILDYEVPMATVWKKVGGIDLLIQGKKDNTVYAVEVKPEKSKETLVRMVAEILTYAEISDYQLENYGKIKPGICFFKDSQQWHDYEAFKNDPDFKVLMSAVDVFYITHTDSAFQICKMD